MPPKTRPLRPWKAGMPLSASHLQEGWDILGAGRLTVTRGNIRGLPNGTTIDIPDEFIPSGGYLATIHSAGPGGEADFTNEQYWVWVNYAIADKWGVPVDMDKGYPYTGTNLTNTIIPATNWSERQPGGPAGSGTHNLTVGLPVLLFPVRGRVSNPTDITTVQRFVFFCEDVGVGQYPGQVLVTEAPHTRQWSFITAVPSLT